MPGKKVKNSGQTQLFNKDGKPLRSNGRYVWVNKKGKRIYKTPNVQRKKDLKELMGDQRRKYGITNEYEACILVANDLKNCLTWHERIQLIKKLKQKAGGLNE